MFFFALNNNPVNDNFRAFFYCHFYNGIYNPAVVKGHPCRAVFRFFLQQDQPVMAIFYLRTVHFNRYWP